MVSPSFKKRSKGTAGPPAIATRPRIGGRTIQIWVPPKPFQERGWRSAKSRAKGRHISPAQGSEMPQLILIRHGQSQWNLENRFTGWWDVDVTEKGVAEDRTSVVQGKSV